MTSIARVYNIFRANWYPTNQDENLTNSNNLAVSSSITKTIRETVSTNRSSLPSYRPPVLGFQFLLPLFSTSRFSSSVSIRYIQRMVGGASGCKFTRRLVPSLLYSNLQFSLYIYIYTGWSTQRVHRYIF